MVLIIDTITWKPHLETSMEIALRRKASGDQVLFCSLRKSLPACEDMSEIHRLLDLPEIRLRAAKDTLAQHGVDFLSANHRNGDILKAKHEARQLLDACQTNSDLRRLSYKDFYDIGWGAISSVVSVKKDSTVSLSSHGELLLNYIASGILVYDKVCAIIAEVNPAEIVLFNGRFVTTRAVLRAAQSRDIPWKIHERGGNKDRYWLTDCMPHDMRAVQRKILSAWRPENVDAGHTYYRARRSRVEKEWHSFTRHQKLGQLPQELQSPGDWIVFFTSSEDEMVSIGDSNSNSLFPTQLDAINAVANAANAIGTFRLCVRVHPHTGEKSRADREKWASLKIPGAIILGPNDLTDSYALIDRAKVVCTYGSTMGIEATYWGRPSLLLNNSFYDELDVCKRVTSLEQMVAYLRQPSLFPRVNSLPYGAFWELLGVPYEYYKADDLHRGSICGRYLDDNKLTAIWFHSRRVLQTLNKWLGRRQ